MKRFSEVYKEMRKEKPDELFLPTGFTSLDNALDGGFLPQELIILGAQTGYGKSYLAGQIFYNIATQGINSCYYSLEITDKMIASRLVGQMANIKPTRISYGLLNKDEFEKRIDAEATITAHDFLMSVEDSIYELDKIVASIKENKFQFVVIDFLQNIRMLGKSEEYSRLSDIALVLQQTAKETNCCILALSQISNMVAREGSKGSTLEYKGSGGIATSTDLGFFMERDEYSPGIEFQGITLTLKKNRRGISGQQFQLFFKHPGGAIYEDPKQNFTY